MHAQYGNPKQWALNKKPNEKHKIGVKLQKASKL
jgi:hypothetical protein